MSDRLRALWRELLLGFRSMGGRRRVALPLRARHRGPMERQRRECCLESVPPGSTPDRRVQPVDLVQQLRLVGLHGREEGHQRPEALGPVVLQVPNQPSSGPEVESTSVAHRPAGIQPRRVAHPMHVMAVLGPRSGSGQSCATVVAH
eukprot:16452065-Heterocapsa_arctica.AAC.1